MAGEIQDESRRSAGKYFVKPPLPEGDSQTIDIYKKKKKKKIETFSIIDIFSAVASGTCAAEVYI